MSEWLDMVWYHKRELDGKGGCEKTPSLYLAEKHSCLDGAGGHQRLFIDVLDISELLLMPPLPRKNATPNGSQRISILCWSLFDSL